MNAPVQGGFQAERSLLAKPADMTVKFGPTKIYRVVLNRRKNIEMEHSEEFPECKNILVVGAGTSMGIFADMFLKPEKYDAIILTHPMVAHYKHWLKKYRCYVVDCEYQPISTHYYDTWAEDINLICRLGKDMTENPPKYKSIAFILPEGRKWNINEVDELVPEKPYSTGAMAMWYALNKFGGKAHVDMIGIDNDGVVARYWQETRHVILEAGAERVTDLAIRMFDLKKYGEGAKE